MIMNNKDKGNIGETIATQYLENLGYKIIERNWHHSRDGEIDIIAEHKQTLVFVEVKARRGLGFGHPLEAVTAKKLNQVTNIAKAYLAQAQTKYSKYRIDAISVILSNPPKIEHVKNIS